jgi:hypothetical protein
MISWGLGFLIIAQQPSPTAVVPPRAAPTRDESKKALELHKKATPRLPMPPEPGAGANPISRVNNGRFRTHYIQEDLRETFGAARPGTTPGTPAANVARPNDPAFSLDNTFKVKLFWIASRANDCFY